MNSLIHQVSQRVRLLLAAVLLSTGFAFAGELPDNWRSLTIAAARLHYASHASSRPARTLATEECFRLKNAADAKVSSVAGALAPLLEEVVPLELARFKAGMAPRDQAASRDKGILGLFLGTTSYPEHMLGQARAASSFAATNSRLLTLEAHRSFIWRRDVLSVVEQYAGPDRSTAGASPLEVKFGILSRDIWISVKNVSGTRLKNCSFTAITRQRGQSDLRYVWFIPALNAGQTVWVEPFHSFAMPRRLGEEFAIQPSLSMEYSLFCNECKIIGAKAASVNGYTIRDPFVRNLIADGRTWVSLGEEGNSNLRFKTHKVEESKQSFRGTVTLEIKGINGLRQYVGTWDEDRVQYVGFHPGAFNITIQDGTGGKQGRFGGNSAGAATLRWIDGKFSLIGLFGTGDDFVPQGEK